jgi:hypothetical protein
MLCSSKYTSKTTQLYTSKECITWCVTCISILTCIQPTLRTMIYTILAMKGTQNNLGVNFGVENI